MNVTSKKGRTFQSHVCIHYKCHSYYYKMHIQKCIELLLARAKVGIKLTYKEEKNVTSKESEHSTKL